jgi:hypothetical protein
MYKEPNNLVVPPFPAPAAAYTSQWAWHRYRGCDNLSLRVVSAYRPNRPGTGGQRTVYAQHLQQLLTNIDSRDPRLAFCEDQKSQLSLWIEAGDDANDDIQNSTFHTMFTNLNMKDTI